MMRGPIAASSVALPEGHLSVDRSSQSNGCVSFTDYHACLNVVRSGEINRLVVVEHLATTPGPQSTSEWPPETIKAPLGSIQLVPSGSGIVENPEIEVNGGPRRERFLWTRTHGRTTKYRLTVAMIATCII
jgi:hypothetical protein